VIILGNRKETPARTEQPTVAKRLRQLVIGGNLVFVVLFGFCMSRAGRVALQRSLVKTLYFKPCHSLNCGLDFWGQVGTTLHLGSFLRPL